MPKVYIVNKAGHDFSAAEQFGELVPITEGNINIARPDRDLYNISTLLKSFNEENDYLLLSGNVLANALAMASLVFCDINKINLLVYDAKFQNYIEHNLVLDDKTTELRFVRKKIEKVEN